LDEYKVVGGRAMQAWLPLLIFNRYVLAAAASEAWCPESG
jgi:hypothetical protein